jgi:CBS domain-containing protein
VIRVELDTGVREIAEVMRNGDVGSVPVVANDKLVGMVTDRDIVIRGVAGADDLAKITAKDVMSFNLMYCYDDDTVEDALRIMAMQQIRRLPVVTRDKRLSGIVSLGDLSQEASPGATGEALERISEPEA